MGIVSLRGKELGLGWSSWATGSLLTTFFWGGGGGDPQSVD